MKKTLLLLLFIIPFTLFGESKKVPELLQKSKSKPKATKATSSTRGENLTKQEFEEYTRLVEEGSTDEEILYQLGLYHLILQDTWYSDKAEYYLKIGAAQDSPRCLFLIVNRCDLRDDDMLDVESYDRLKELAEADYKDAKEWFDKIHPNQVKRIELKRQGIIIDD